MSMADEDVQQAAIDTSDGGENYTPPAQQEAPQAAAPAAPAAPAPQASAGIPNVGPAPIGQEAASTPVGAGMQKLGSQIASDVGQGVENVKNSVPGQVTKRIISYLMGADASHPEMLDQAAQQVDPHGQMTEADRNLLAIDKAHSTGGEKASWPLLQANRVAYNGKAAFAKTALEGTQQKPADLNAAIDAANKAQANVPDGSNIKFQAAPGGVTATVTMPGTSQVQRINLNPQQFSQFLDVGNGGQWDKLMEHGAPAVLQKIASSGGQTKLGQAQPLAKAPAPDNSESDAYQPPQLKTNAGKTPSSLNLSGDDNVRQAYQPPADGPDSDVNRSYKMFPRAHLDETENAKREAWLASQEENDANRQNRVDVAGETGKQRIKVAEATGRSRENVATTAAGAKVEGAQLYSGAKTKAAQINADTKLAAQGNVQAQQRIESARKAIAVKRQTAGTLTPEDEALERQLTQAASGRPQQAPQAPAQPAAPQQQAEPQRSAQDQQAAAWAKANPNDPRSKAIMQRLQGAQ